jgi:hypothetical protein
MIIQKKNKAGLDIFYLENQTQLKNCQSEDVEQMQFTFDLRYNYPDLLYLHPVNEGNIPVNYRDKLLKKGLLPGASDIIILKPNKHFSYLVIELKRQCVSKSKISQNQKEFLESVKNQGGFACVAYGASAAVFIVEEYLNNCLTFVS